ncbi:MAG: IclR family transcriptional regulator [Ignavibacteriales bacterium]
MGESYRSVRRTTSILEALARNPAGLDLGGVAVETGLDRSTAYRFLKSLVDVGVMRQVAGGKYQLSWKMYEIGTSLLLSQGIDLKAIYPVLERLSSITGQSSNMAVMDNHEVIYVAAVNSQGIVQTVFRVGGRLPAYCTALGKAILSQWSPDEARRYVSSTEFQRYTDNTILDKNRFLKELEDARARCYAVQSQEIVGGVHCMAAPLFNMFDEPFASVGISGHSAAFLATPAMAREVISSARQLSQYFGAPRERLSYFDRSLETLG